MDTIPDGLFWYEHFLTPTELAQLEQWLTQLQYFPVPSAYGKVGQNPRYAAHFGYYYPYTRGKHNNRQIPAGVGGGYYNLAPPLTPWMLKIRERIYWLLRQQRARNVTLDVSPQDTFDQVIINRYPPKQGISAHVDAVKAYGSIVVSITVGVPSKMIFRHKDGRVFELTPPPGSIYIMTGSARYEWTHEMPKTGINAGERISLTYRSMNK